MVRRRGFRAQAAVEYFVIAAMVMMFMIPVWVHITTTQQNAGFELSLSYARNSVKQIADAASLVHSQGAPAKINIKVYIPAGVENVSIIDKTLIMKVNTGGQVSEVWHESSATLQGEDQISTNEGYYYFDIISHDSYVEINRTV
jgi:hypothetical protein